MHRLAISGSAKSSAEANGSKPPPKLPAHMDSFHSDESSSALVLLSITELEIEFYTHIDTIQFVPALDR
jgi:hypothetical protein